MNKFKCTLKADRAGMKKGTVIEVITSLASCDAHNIADACEAKFGKKSRDASHPSYWDIKKVYCKKECWYFKKYQHSLKFSPKITILYKV